MIPRLKQAPGVDLLVQDYLDALKQSGFSGDVATHYADRLTMATDNSIYQLLPQAIIFPRSTADVVLIARTGHQPQFSQLKFSPRGGGTGTNGQSLNDGIVVDMSRYMNRILEINLDQGWVRVEAGVIKDQLNQYLKPRGYFFSPELSTSNRATLGGMINTDASGQGSQVYGKTSDHVLGLRSVLLNGELLDTYPVPVALAQQLAAQQTQVGQIYQTVLERCYQQRELVLEKFPQLNRFLTGYDLRHVFSDDLQTFDLSRILTGSEGSLAIITEARLNITPLPAVRRLVNVKYDSFDSALRNAPLMVEVKALSVETVDSKVFNLAREDIIWESVKNLITDVPDKDMQGLNIIEFAGDDIQLINDRVEQLCARLEQLMSAGKAGIIGYQLCSDLADIERIYAMRKKAVGLLGNAKGSAKPIPFAEDTCVPPEHLAEYITEFRALLDSHNLSYGMFGHVDAGVLHVRPALDMCDPQQEILMKQLSDQIVSMTAKYGGLLWGEHGKGFRAEYSPEFFGPELYDELRRIKAAFDPENRLNPGKICSPKGKDDPVFKVDAVKRGTFDRRIPLAVRTAFKGAMECNGNGLCFNFDVNSPMCPSMKVSANRVHSPKGRASLIREWLRLLAEEGVDPLQIEQRLTERCISWRSLLDKTKNGWSKRKGEYDFSHEVKQSMAGCLACKACSTQCPIKIDVPAFRARFLQLYHTRYFRPTRDYLVASVESYAPIMAKAPKVFNFFIRQSWMQSLSVKSIGMINLPLLSTPTLKQQLQGHKSCCMTLEQLENLAPDAKPSYVLIVQDPFTSYYDAKVVADFAKLVEKLGMVPVLLPFSPNGKAQHIKGFLTQFAKTAKRTSEVLNRVAKLNISMVGVDPALVLCYRDEYQQMLGDRRGSFQVQLVHEWLMANLDRYPKKSMVEEPWYLFGHCTESTALPASGKQWQSVFSHFGAQLDNVNLGCCGMAGTYGHEADNAENSANIYALSWQRALVGKNAERCLATGYSCRSQVKRFNGVVLKHPLQALLELV